jgi:hypothetical protein
MNKTNKNKNIKIKEEIEIINPGSRRKMNRKKREINRLAVANLNIRDKGMKNANKVKRRRQTKALMSNMDKFGIMVINAFAPYNIRQPSMFDPPTRLFVSETVSVVQTSAAAANVGFYIAAPGATAQMGWQANNIATTATAFTWTAATAVPRIQNVPDRADMLLSRTNAMTIEVTYTGPIASAAGTVLVGSVSSSALGAATSFDELSQLSTVTTVGPQFLTQKRLYLSLSKDSDQANHFSSPASTSQNVQCPFIAWTGADVSRDFRFRIMEKGEFLVDPSDPLASDSQSGETSISSVIGSTAIYRSLAAVGNLVTMAVDSSMQNNWAKVAADVTVAAGRYLQSDRDRQVGSFKRQEQHLLEYE